MPTKKQQRSPPGRQQPRRKWSRDVATDSTHPPPGLFTQDAKTVARTMASPKVSPRGIGSGIRMIQFFINRAGKSLSASRRRELERAKHILQDQRPPAAKNVRTLHQNPHAPTEKETSLHRREPKNA